ncbi:DUF302 domain-containing protein [Halomicroarcula limicola]|uniref:DUF302 domain-containing protein n=1 Tax=Haloarcula limicola TaxID=1429915 RepID=A0A8J8C3C1_9EURY|nr:DUF302 domain-containing protein [Halomicroarcula limicola]MBV0924326.1 DUF302 domain-containing protein [Halomicroarcula limicola]
MANYTVRYRVDGEFDDTVAAVEDELAEEGFGVLCDIDVQATLKKKLDEEFRQYRILGACNPSLAHEALQEELELGALLPCNVIVYERDDGDVGVSAVDPQVMLSVADNDALDSIAEDVGERLTRVLEALPNAEPAED